MTFVTTSNCNTVDNIYVKTYKRLGSQNERSDIANKYSFNLIVAILLCYINTVL